MNQGHSVFEDKDKESAAKAQIGDEGKLDSDNSVSRSGNNGQHWPLALALSTAY